MKFSVKYSALFLPLLLLSQNSARSQNLSESALQQIRAVNLEKASRSSAQNKMDSQLVLALRPSRKEAIAAAVPLLKPALEFEPDGRVVVDIQGSVTPALSKQIEQ